MSKNACLAHAPFAGEPPYRDAFQALSRGNVNRDSQDAASRFCGVSAVIQNGGFCFIHRTTVLYSTIVLNVKGARRFRVAFCGSAGWFRRTYATNTPMPETPVWQLVFVNARLFFVGSDDVPAEAKIEATRDINKALEAEWQGLDIAEIVPLDQTARAHELVEHPAKAGRIIVAIR